MNLKIIITLILILSITQIVKPQFRPNPENNKDSLEVLDEILTRNKNVSPFTIGLQAVSGSGGGIVLGALCGAIGYAIDPNEKEGSGVPIIAALLGYSVGNALGVYFTGDENYRKGSFVPTLIGSVAATWVPLFLIEDGSDYIKNTGGFLLLTTACAIIPYYIFGSSNSDAVVSLSKNNINLSVPNIIFRQQTDTGDLYTGIEIFRLSL